MADTFLPLRRAFVCVPYTPYGVGNERTDGGGNNHVGRIVQAEQQSRTGDRRDKRDSAMTALRRNTRLPFARPSSSPSGKRLRAKLRTVRIIMTDTITAAPCDHSENLDRLAIDHCRRT